MITFRHGVNQFTTLRMECEGTADGIAYAAAAALMNAAKEALKLRHPPRLEISASPESVRIRCEYNQQTAEIALVTICGFQWLAEQQPDAVKVERISSKYVNETGHRK